MAGLRPEDTLHWSRSSYRAYKGDIWEGGHRVPLVIRWPGHIKPNTSTSNLACLTDVFATCADAINTKLPATGAEDSLSFLPAALDQSQVARVPIVNHSNFGEFAYRDGDWKLIYRNAAPLEKARSQHRIPELYNLKTNPAESTNLAAERPEIVTRLTTELESLVSRGSTRPLPTASNDAPVRFDLTQTTCWAAEQD